MKIDIILLLILFAKITLSQHSENIVVDAKYDFATALSGVRFPDEIKKQLALVQVKYYGLDGKIHSGQLVIHKKLESEIKEIFDKLLAIKFPIKSVIPIVRFGWDDEKSMLANNTSAFNYRVIKGTERLSKHAFGTAIDINPFFNPYVKPNSVEPKGAEYIPERKGTITANSEITKIFKSYGWSWGGDWSRGKDYQHFEKDITR